MGLGQLFRDTPYPDLLARALLNVALEDFRETGHHYLMHLVAERDFARRRGTREEISALDDQIHEHAIHEQTPQRWQLDFLFSHAGYRTYGDGLLASWATVLIQICTLEQHWERMLLGLRPRNPHLLPGFHSDEDVWSPAWLEHFRRTWEMELKDVYLQLGAWLL